MYARLNSWGTMGAGDQSFSAPAPLWRSAGEAGRWTATAVRCCQQPSWRFALLCGQLAAGPAVHTVELTLQAAGRSAVGSLDVDDALQRKQPAGANIQFLLVVHALHNLPVFTSGSSHCQSQSEQAAALHRAVWANQAIVTQVVVNLLTVSISAIIICENLQWWQVGHVQALHGWED